MSASQSLSPVSQFVSHLALSFTLGGVLCPPRWACLPICLPSGFVSQFSLPICFPSGFVFHLGWGAVSASLGLSPVLSPNLSPTWLCLSPWLGCCVRLAGLVCGLVSQFVSHLALSPTQFCLRMCSPSGFAFHLVWGAVSASRGLSGLVSQCPQQAIDATKCNCALRSAQAYQCFFIGCSGMHILRSRD